ncbi:MAG: hypothetical protein ACOY90_02105 [Candidatus Zhuqueibacterota bacterium]
MTHKTRYTIGLVIGILGIVFLLLNAADYVMRWNQISSGISGIGIALTVIGAGLMVRTKGNR